MERWKLLKKFFKDCIKNSNFFDIIPNLVAVDSANCARDVAVVVDRDRAAGFERF